MNIYSLTHTFIEHPRCYVQHYLSQHLSQFFTILNSREIPVQNKSPDNRCQMFTFSFWVIKLYSLMVLVKLDAGFTIYSFIWGVLFKFKFQWCERGFGWMILCPNSAFPPLRENRMGTGEIWLASPHLWQLTLKCLHIMI